MSYIITSKTRRYSRPKAFKECYLRPGGLEEAERNGIRKGDAFIEINHLTDSMSADERRDIVNEFVDREKAK